MTLANSFTVASFLYLTLLRLVSVYSSLETPEKGADSLSSIILNASTKNGTQPVDELEDDTDEDDFPPLSFFIKDVLTTSLGRVNRTATPQLNASRLFNIDALTDDETPFENLSRLNYETYWGNGSLTLTLVDLEKGDQNATRSHYDVWDKLSDFELEDVAEGSKLGDDDLQLFDHSKLTPSRRRRDVFGSDDRVEVTAEASKQLPYSAVVQITTGCTGTLISPYHVLTAAHCIHDGLDYYNVQQVRVGILRRPGKMRWIRVAYVKVPRGWTLSHDYRYDYAVLRLRRQPPLPTRHLEMYEIPEGLEIPLRIQFASFPRDKADYTMWYSYCKAHCLRHAILNRCDSFFGSSGAGIYGKIKKGRNVERFVMGVFSGSSDRVRFRGKIRRMNVGTKITPLKLAQIRSWVAASRLIKNTPLLGRMPAPNQ